MGKKYIILLIIIYLNPIYFLAEDIWINQNNQSGYISPNGLVSDSTTAIKIAFAIWKPIYGEIINEPNRENRATLKVNLDLSIPTDSIWFVSNIFKATNTSNQITFGHNHYILISRSDGRIIKVWGSK